MARILMAAAAAAVMLSACIPGAGGDKQAFIDGCVKGGDDKKTCECVGTEFEKTIDKQAFHAMALQAAGKTEEADKIINALPVDKQMAMATAMMRVMMNSAATPS